MELLSDENINPSDSKTRGLLAQGFLSESLFTDVFSIKNEPLTDTYTIEPRPFARGKFATVRRCRHKVTGQDFAAKCIRKRRRAADVRHEILHEVCVLNLSSPCKRIVRLHEVYETPTEVILVLEMLSGGELQRLIDDEVSISESDVARLIRQVLEGLFFLHERNIAHLDIKPQNILLTSSFPQCDVKLCDFGISRMMTKGVDIREIVGTPDYVAPEVLHYEPICLATDMWSMGILTYVLLSGHTPFGGDTKQETFCNITNGNLDFPRDLFGTVSNSAKDFMRRLLVRDPSDRLSVKECLKHSWLSSQSSAPQTSAPFDTTHSVPLILSPSTENLVSDPPQNALERQQSGKITTNSNNSNNTVTPEEPLPETPQPEESTTPEPEIISGLTESLTELQNQQTTDNKTAEYDIDNTEYSTSKNEDKVVVPDIVLTTEPVESELEKVENSQCTAEIKTFKNSTKIEEPFEEIAIIPLEAVIEVTNHDNDMTSLCHINEQTLDDAANNIAIHLLPDLTTPRRNSTGNCPTGKVLKEHHMNHRHTTSSHHHVQITCNTSTTTSERKTKSEMVEFEGLALSKRLIFSEEILVDERMGMVY